ncbi:DUF4097 family beta strand repeat-containing protein [Flagellimonas nanhaiensis]|uniref:DUF4097 domain-containing protein n=1 Tax=Flagellimonas nanhaiensis TaxID=2292706 RepID=A0A371JN79_9FLAO|nr:DUF4097 family beta strand repeat-containing protein [Allomuricauda nanhaiensis]RDY58699.1 hypothetical protein DX873_13535 [Allomuricauda nanhaiensis]
MIKFKTVQIILLLLIANVTLAQEKAIDLFTVPLSSPGSPGKLVIDQITGSITVDAYEGAEVIIKASFGSEKRHYQEDKKDNNRNGMKRINGSSLNVSAEEKNNVVQVVNEQWNRITNLQVKVPRNFSLKLSTVNDGNILVNGVNGEMEISNVNGEITLQDVSGSASADTVNGDVKVNFNSIESGANMAFSSLNGDLDITFPSSLKADVKAKSDMGEVFTDFEMEVSETKPEVSKNENSGTYKVSVEQWVRGKINGGGPEMIFKTFNGDILIRSK